MSQGSYRRQLIFERLQVLDRPFTSLYISVSGRVRSFMGEEVRHEKSGYCKIDF